jgi:hypothetical protein
MPHKSRNSKSFGEVFNHMGLLASGLTANASELPHLEVHRLKLVTVVGEVQDLLSEKKIQTSVKQDLSRRVEALLDQGSKLASFLRAGVKQHYGTRSEKLVEFDLPPFRGRAASAKAPVVKKSKVKEEVAEEAKEESPKSDD